MGYDTKPNLDSSKFEQRTGDTLNLSGLTKIYNALDIKSGATFTLELGTEFNINSGSTFSINSGVTFIFKENSGQGKVLTSDSGGTISLQMPSSGIAVTGATAPLEVVNYKVKFDYTNDNICLGTNALASNTGLANIGLGTCVLLSNTGNCNIGLGKCVLRNNTGSYNIGFGDGAIYLGNTGTHNIGIGYHALFCNTSGYRNIAIGSGALSLNSIGWDNIAMGNCALGKNLGCFNIGLGANVMNCNTTGNYNVAVGKESSFFNTTGRYNVALGENTLYYNLDGSCNVAIGVRAMWCKTNGAQNIAIGRFTLGSNYIGNYNIGIGSVAGECSTGGSYNILMGYGAGRYETGSSKIYIGTGDVIGKTLICGDMLAQTLKIAGALKTSGLTITDGTQALGYVLTSDANGLASWQPSSGGTSGGTSYIFTNGLTETSGTVKLGGTYSNAIYLNSSTSNGYFGLGTNGIIDQYAEDTVNESFSTIWQTMGVSPSLQLDAGIYTTGARYDTNISMYKNYIRIHGNTNSIPNVNVCYDICGLKYSCDVASCNTSNPRWIPDKAYVDSLTGSTGSGLTTASNGLTASSTNVKLGGTLSENTCIRGNDSYGMSVTGLTHFCVAAPIGFSSPIELLTDGVVTLKGCNACATLGGASFDIIDVVNGTTIQFGTGGDIRFCKLQAKNTETNVIYINSSTGRLASGSTVASAGGSDGNMQYNNGGSFGGTCLNWDDSVNHMGWGIAASGDTMLKILKDVSYDSGQNVIEILGKNTIDEPVSEFKVYVGGPSWGSAVSVRCIDGYFQGAYSDLLINTECSTSNVCIQNPIANKLGLVPTTVPAAVEGMIYYDNSAKKLKFYNGTAWETVTSST